MAGKPLFPNGQKVYVFEDSSSREGPEFLRVEEIESAEEISKNVFTHLYGDGPENFIRYYFSLSPKEKANGEERKSYMDLPLSEYKSLRNSGWKKSTGRLDLSLGCDDEDDPCSYTLTFSYKSAMLFLKQSKASAEKALKTIYNEKVRPYDTDEKKLKRFAPKVSAPAIG